MAETLQLLRKVPVFEGLPEEHLEWFLNRSQELRFKPGETYSRQGDPADAMFVVLEGDVQGRGELAGDSVVLPIPAGSVTGTLPFSRMKTFTLSGRAVTAVHLLRYPASLFPELVQKSPELATRLVGLMSDRIRETTRFEQQRDRLAGLGKLSAGLAHELNNPASAAKRASSQLRDLLKRVRDASHELGKRDLTSAQKAEIEKLEASLTQANIPHLDPLAVSDLEEQIDSCFAATGKTTCGSLPRISLDGTSACRLWNKSLPCSIRIPRAPPWSGSPLPWKFLACCRKLRAVPREFPTWCAPSRNTRSWIRLHCRTWTS